MDKPNRRQRNDDYLNTGAPALQDTDPEPLTGMGTGYWRLMLVIGIVAALLYFVATRM